MIRQAVARDFDRVVVIAMCPAPRVKQKNLFTSVHKFLKAMFGQSNRQKKM